MSGGQSVRATTVPLLLPVTARQLENGSWVLESKLKPEAKEFHAFSELVVKIPSRAEFQDDSKPPEWWPMGVPVPKFKTKHSGLTPIRREAVRAFLFQQKDEPLRLGKPGEQKWLEAVMEVLKEKKTSYGVTGSDILYWIRYNFELGAVFRHVYVPRDELNSTHKNSKSCPTKESQSPARVPPRKCEPQPGPSRPCMPNDETPTVPHETMKKRKVEGEKPSNVQIPSPPQANPELPALPAYNGVFDTLAAFSVDSTRLENGSLMMRHPHAIPKGKFIMTRYKTTQTFPPEKVAPSSAGQSMLQEESKSGPQHDGGDENQV